MTTLTEKPADQTGLEVRRLQGRLRAMTIAVVLLAVAVIGLGAWVIYDLVSQSDTAVTGEVESLLDDYTTAWNAHDGEAFLDLVTASYTFEYAGDVNSAEEEAAVIDGLGVYDWSVETVGDPIMFGDGPTYYVAVADHITSNAGDSNGISLYAISQVGDTYKIANHIFVGG